MRTADEDGGADEGGAVFMVLLSEEVVVALMDGMEGDDEVGAFVIVVVGALFGRLKSTLSRNEAAMSEAEGVCGNDCDLAVSSVAFEVVGGVVAVVVFDVLV